MFQIIISQRCDNIIDNLFITPQIIEEIINKLYNNSSMSGAGIHPRLFRNLSTLSSTKFRIIFNSTSDEGSLTVEWVSSVVVPIYKNSSKIPH